MAEPPVPPVTEMTEPPPAPVTTATPASSAAAVASPDMEPDEPEKPVFHHVIVPVADPHGARRQDLVHAPNEFLRAVPYAYSLPHLLFFGLLVVLSLGLLGVVSVWFPQVFTHIARQRLPHSSLCRAEYLLILVHEDGFRSVWVEVKLNVMRPPKKRVSCWQKLKARIAKIRGDSKTLDDGGSDKGAAAYTKREAPGKLWVWLEFKKHRYLFNHDKGEYERYLASISEDLKAIHARAKSGLSDAHHVTPRLELYGGNVIDIEQPHVPVIAFSKFVHPFFLFQVFSATVWFIEDYSIYAAVILGLATIALVWETYSEVSNTMRLRNMVRSDRQVKVVRDHATVEVHEGELVPGDIIVVEEGVVCADMLLISGVCEANEANVTGESLSVIKAPAAATGHIKDAYARDFHKASFLHAGSTITRVRQGVDECKAVVVNTGFATDRGELFRGILYPRPLTFEFERDTYRYLSVLVVIAIAAFIKRVVDANDIGNTFGYTIIHALDLITIAIPPALPLVLSVGINFARLRLSMRKIACMDMRRINSCGQLTCFCFDKTGTLTEDALTFAGVTVELPYTKEHGLSMIVVDSLSRRDRLGLVACHEITSEEDQSSALSKAVFAALDCSLEPSEDSKTAIVTHNQSPSPGYEILQRFPFDVRMQRSSVLVRDLETKERFIWVKGSADAIRAISVVTPARMDEKIREFTSDGYHCVAFGVRKFEAEDTAPLDLEKRADFESGLEFVSIMLFSNKVKPESKAVIKELYSAGLDVRMITGDSAHRALEVGRQIEMKLEKTAAVVDVNEKTNDVQLSDVDAENAEHEWHHFTGSNISRLLNTYDIALTGRALDVLRAECEPETLQHVLRQTLIFARIRPQQKTWIVEQLMDMGHFVGMCGDGANNCGALRTAHVGLALLSGAEASAVAPFTSTLASIEDVPALIKEGRCAIMTSFLAFKFMVLYPLIQLAMATTLAHFDLVLSTNQYVWDDMAIVLGLALTMLCTGASKELSMDKPPRTLFSPKIIVSLVGQVAIVLAFFAGNFALLKNQPTSWFCRIHDGIAYLKRHPGAPKSCAIYLAYNSVDNPYSYEDSSVWLFGHLLFISVAAAFNLRDPFRLPLYRNKAFTLLLLGVLGVNLWFLLDTSGVVDATFQLMPLPFAFRWKMLVMFLGHFVAAIGWEFVATCMFSKVERPAWAQRLAAMCHLS
ncbi:Ring finger protein nhl-1 [Globisporangium polare]